MSQPNQDPIPGAITRRRPPIAATIFVTVVAMYAALPWVVGLIQRPADTMYFASYARAPGDTPVYYRYIDEGRFGGPMMGDGYTSDAPQKILWQPLWWTIGRAAQLFHLSTPVAFMLSRVTMAVVLAAVLLWAAKQVFFDRRTQILAAWLGYFGAGMGGFIWYAARAMTDGMRYPPFDLWVSEGYPWMSSLATPHFLLVTTGLLFTVVGIEYAWHRPWVRWTIGPVFLLAISIHPFHILTIGLLWGVLTIIDLWRHAPRWWDRVWPRLQTGLWAIPALLYYALTLSDPLVSGRAQQNVNSTDVWALAVGVIPLILLAIMGVRRATTRQMAPFIWWTVAILFVTFLPISFQRRFFQPPVIPLGFLVAAAIQVRWRIRPLQVGLIIAGLVVMVASPIALVQQSLDFLRTNRQTSSASLSYVPDEYERLFTAFRDHPEWAPVLTDTIDGDIVAAFRPMTVYLGHGVETLDYSNKVSKMKHFYRDWTPTEQQAFLHANGICSVLVTPHERAVGQAFPGQGWDSLTRVFHDSTVELYTTGVCAPRITN